MSVAIAAAEPSSERVAGQWLDSIRAQARLRPREIALRAQDASIDYAELLDRAGRLAAVLQARGLRPGDVVALTAERDPATLVLMLAILLAGGACLPLDAAYPPARLAAMLDDARPRLLIADAQGGHALPDGTARVDRSALETAAAATAPLATQAPGERIYVLFTSGSSGRPKGVAMRSAVLGHLVAWHASHPRLGHAARTLQFAPLSFDVSFQEMLVTFAAGGTLVLPTEAERRDPYALLALIARERVERIFLPYVALQALAEAVATGGQMPATLRDVVTAGEQLRVTPAIRALFAGLDGGVLHNHYGPTETHVVTAHELDGDPAQWPELPPIGRPLPHVKVRLVDASLRDVDAMAEGELLLGGDCLAAGYIHRPDLTAERFIELDGERWYRTGDGVCDVGDGVLAYRGRLDQQIKLDGFRIEPAEIESVLGRHPGVAEAVVVAVDDARGRRLVAHVVPRDAQADETALVGELRARGEELLPVYLRPHAFVVLPLLPLTASGKIDRRALANANAAAPLQWPQDAPLPEQLRGLWQQLLGLAEIDVRQNLFDLGARSLTVVRALTELRRRGFHTLSAAQIYEHPSVERLAALLSGAPAAVPSSADESARGHRQRAALARFAPRRGGLQ
jgi:amino acid adenylation domain-containing protein